MIIIAVIFLVFFWASAFIGIKIALEGLTPGHLSVLRFLIASGTLFPVLLVFKARLIPKTKDIPYFFMLGALGISIYHTALNFGEVQVSAGAAALILATVPALSAILARFILKDRLPVLAWVGIVISFLGVVLISIGDSASFGLNIYALLIMLSAVVAAFANVLQKPMFKDYKAIEVSAYMTWTGTLLLLIFLPQLPADIATAGWRPLLATAYIGIFSAAIANALFTFILSKIPVGQATSYLYAIPVTSLIIAWIVLGEIPSQLTAVGGAIALIGIVIVNEARKNSKTS